MVSETTIAVVSCRRLPVHIGMFYPFKWGVHSIKNAPLSTCELYMWKVHSGLK